MVVIQTSKPLKARPENDHYRTDPLLCLNALKLLNIVKGEISIIDPGAGTGSWGQSARELWGTSHIIGVENDSQFKKPGYYDTWLPDDFLLHEFRRESVDLVMGNPPYKYAEGFVTHSLQTLRRQGHLLFLLRNDFVAGQGRMHGLFTYNKPANVYVCSRRPSFYENGRTNAIEFALFHWVKGFHPEKWVTHLWDWKTGEVV